MDIIGVKKKEKKEIVKNLEKCDKIVIKKRIVFVCFGDKVRFLSMFGFPSFFPSFSF